MSERPSHGQEPAKTEIFETPETTQEPGVFQRLRKKLGRKTTAVALAGTLLPGAGIAAHEMLTPEEREKPRTSAAERVQEAFTAVNAVEDMFKTQVTNVKEGEPGFFEGYGGKVPTIEFKVESKRTPLAEKHVKSLSDDQPELEWRHRLVVYNTFYDENGKEKFRQASWPQIEGSKLPSTTVEEPLLDDGTDDGTFKVTIPMGVPGERTMVIGEKLDIEAHGVPTKDKTYPKKELVRPLGILRVDRDKAGTINIKQPLEVPRYDTLEQKEQLVRNYINAAESAPDIDYTAAHIEAISKNVLDEPTQEKLAAASIHNDRVYKVELPPGESSEMNFWEKLAKQQGLGVMPKRIEDIQLRSERGTVPVVVAENQVSTPLTIFFAVPDSSISRPGKIAITGTVFPAYGHLFAPRGGEGYEVAPRQEVEPRKRLADIDLSEADPEVTYPS